MSNEGAGNLHPKKLAPTRKCSQKPGIIHSWGDAYKPGGFFVELYVARSIRSHWHLGPSLSTRLRAYGGQLFLGSSGFSAGTYESSGAHLAVRNKKFSPRRHQVTASRKDMNWYFLCDFAPSCLCAEGFLSHAVAARRFVPHVWTHTKAG